MTNVKYSLAFGVSFLAVSLVGSSCHQATQPGPTETVQYPIFSLSVPDSVAHGDTLSAIVGLMVDCTDKVTKVDTTLRFPEESIAIFVTKPTGPTQTGCPVGMIHITIPIVISDKGTLRVVGLQPSGQNIVDTVVVY